MSLDYITVTVRNTSIFDHTYDMVDKNDGRTWSQFVAASGHSSIRLKSNHALDDGYGDLLYRIQGSSGWIENGLLRNGETITL
jgi:hypothetical protein